MGFFDGIKMFLNSTALTPNAVPLDKLIKKSGGLRFELHNDELPPVEPWASLTSVDDSISYDKNVVIVNGEIYVNTNGSNPRFLKFNIAKRTWYALKPFPAMASSSPKAVLNGVIYFTGLQGTTYELSFKYDIATDSWTPFANFPGGNGATSDAIAYNGAIYVAQSGTSSRGFYKYDPTTNAWTALANTPYGVNGGIRPKMAVLSGEIYLVGAADNVSRNFQKYNPANNSWTVLGTTILPEVATYYGITVLGGELCMVGASVVDTVNIVRYDREANACMEPERFAIRSPSVATNLWCGESDGKLYYRTTSDLYEYDPDRRSEITIAEVTQGDKIFYNTTGQSMKLSLNETILEEGESVAQTSGYLKVVKQADYADTLFGWVK